MLRNTKSTARLESLNSKRDVMDSYTMRIPDQKIHSNKAVDDMYCTFVVSTVKIRGDALELTSDTKDMPEDIIVDSLNDEFEGSRAV